MLSSTHREMLLGFVVLVEVDAGSVVVLHGVAGQQLSKKEESFHSVHVRAPVLFFIILKYNTHFPNTQL